MSNSTPSRVRRWLPSVATGVVYGLVWGLGTALLGRATLIESLLFGLIAATTWTAFSLWFRGPLTRWRDRRIAKATSHDDAEEEAS